MLLLLLHFRSLFFSSLECVYALSCWFEIISFFFFWRACNVACLTFPKRAFDIQDVTLPRLLPAILSVPWNMFCLSLSFYLFLSVSLSLRFWTVEDPVPSVLVGRGARCISYTLQRSCREILQIASYRENEKKKNFREAKKVNVNNIR